MKTVTFFCFAILTATSFFSCKKCIECKGKAGNGEVKQEFCGSKSEREAGETAFKAVYTDTKCE